MLFPLFSSSYQLPPLLVLRKENADSNQAPIDKKNNGIQKKFENFRFSLVEVEV